MSRDPRTPADPIGALIDHEVGRRDFLRIAAFATGGASLAFVLDAAARASRASAQSDVIVTTPVHLILGSYVFGNVADVWAKQIADYTAKYPNFTIDTEFADYSGFMDKLTTEIAAGSPPDIAMLVPDTLPKYHAQDLLLDLDAYIGEIDLSEWYPQAWEGLSFGADNHRFAVPLTFDTSILWYNKDLFDAVGHPYPDETWTYDDVVEAALALTKRDDAGNTTQWGLGLGWEPWYQFMKMFGVDPWDKQDFTKSNFGSPEAIAAIQKAADLYVTHKVSPVQPPNSGLAVSGADVQFTAGQMAMLMGGTWNTQTYLDPTNGITSFKFDCTYAPLAAAGAPRKSVGQDNVFVIFKSTANPDAAWQFVRDNVLSQTGQEELGAAVEIPALKSAAENTYKKSWLDQLEHGAIQLDQMEKYTDNIQFGLLDENTWMVEVDNQLDAAWKGGDVAAICASIATKLDELLAEAQAKYGNS